MVYILMGHVVYIYICALLKSQRVDMHVIVVHERLLISNLYALVNIDLAEKILRRE